jgi:hypothetical protein
MTAQNWHRRALLLVFTLLGLSWFYRIDDCRLWIDEFFSLNIAQRPLALIWSMDSHPNKFYFNTLPPLYETVLHFFWDISGQNLFLPRLLSLAFTGLAIFLIFKLTALLFDKATGVYAALLATVNASYLLFAQMIRGYAFLNALTLASLYLFFRMVKTGDFRKRYLAGLLAVNVCILYTSYLGAIVILAEIFFSIFLFRNRVSKQIHAWLAGAFLFFLPWGKHFLEDIRREPVMDSSIFSHGDILTGFLERFEKAFNSAPLFFLYMAVFMAVFVYGVILFKKKREKEKALWIIALGLFFLIPTAAVNGMSFRVFDAMRMRYFFVFLFPLFMFAALFIRKFRGWAGGVLLAVFFFGSFAAVYAYSWNPKEKFGPPADIALLAEEARAFSIPAGDKVDIEIETDLYVPIFVYYFYGPEHLREVSYPHLWAGHKSINRASEVYKLFYNIARLDKGVLGKKQVESAGCNWDYAVKQLVRNGWATPISPEELMLKVNLKDAQSRVAEVFGADFYKIQPVIQRAQNDLVVKSVLAEKCKNAEEIFDWLVGKGHLQRVSGEEGRVVHHLAVIEKDLKKEYPEEADQAFGIVRKSLKNHFLQSVFDLQKIDWLFLLYADWDEPCWGGPFPEFYKERAGNSGFKGRLDLVRQRRVGAFTLEIYKVNTF